MGLGTEVRYDTAGLSPSADVVRFPEPRLGEHAVCPSVPNLN
jgi:hypothetical protein